MIACALASVLMPLVGRGADWQMSGNDLTNDRNQPHGTLINVGNVATLKPAWTFKALGSVSATPLVAGGSYHLDWQVIHFFDGFRRGASSSQVRGGSLYPYCRRRSVR
jgi:hypothetical protein